MKVRYRVLNPWLILCYVNGSCCQQTVRIRHLSKFLASKSVAFSCLSEFAYNEETILHVIWHQSIVSRWFPISSLINLKAFLPWLRFFYSHYVNGDQPGGLCLARFRSSSNSSGTSTTRLVGGYHCTSDLTVQKCCFCLLGCFPWIFLQSFVHYRSAGLEVFSNQSLSCVH